jgi:hypothetical protein
MNIKVIKYHFNASNTSWYVIKFVIKPFGLRHIKHICENFQGIFTLSPSLTSPKVHQSEGPLVRRPTSPKVR